MSIRLRLALSYAGLLALIFLLFDPLVYSAFQGAMLSGTDGWLAPFSEHVLHSLNSGDRSAPLSLPDGSLEPFASPGLSVELLDPNGKLLARSSNMGEQDLPVPDNAFASAWWGAPASFTATVQGRRYRALLTPIPGIQEPRGFVLVASSLRQMDETLGRIRALLVLLNGVGLLLAALVSWLIARRNLQPIEEITETARAITLSRGFGRRLKVSKTQDEVGRLSLTLNEMLASLDAAYDAQRRFVSDASHELRSPLTSIRSNIEYLQRALEAPAEDRSEALADVAAEVERMSRMTSDLLLLAKADAGHKIEMGPVALNDLLAEIYRQRQASRLGIKLELASVQPATVPGNATWLKQLLLILVDNALKYTPQGGNVSLSLSREVDRAVIRVSDTGIGIPQSDLPHIFERFYRGVYFRARDEGGAGLGLAIARWIVEEHGGQIEAQSESGIGTTFTVRLPAI